MFKLESIIDIFEWISQILSLKLVARKFLYWATTTSIINHVNVWHTMTDSIPLRRITILHNTSNSTNLDENAGGLKDVFI